MHEKLALDTVQSPFQFNINPAKVRCAARQTAHGAPSLSPPRICLFSWGRAARLACTYTPPSMWCHIFGLYADKRTATARTRRGHADRTHGLPTGKPLDAFLDDLVAHLGYLGTAIDY